MPLQGAGSPGLAGSPPPGSGNGAASAGDGSGASPMQQQQQQSQFVQMALPPGLDREKLAALSQVSLHFD